MLNAKWSATERARLETLYQNGLDDDQLAMKLARSPKAIRIQRSKQGLVQVHIDRKKGKLKFPERKKPVRGKMPTGAQLRMEDMDPVHKTPFEVVTYKVKGITKTIARKIDPLAGVEELHPGPTIEKTIHSEIGTKGAINIWNTDGEAEITIYNLSATQAARLLANLISKIV